MQVHEATLFTLSPTVAAHFSSLTRASTARGRSTSKHQQHQQQQQTGGTLSYRRVPLLPTVFYGYPLPVQPQSQPQSQRSLLSRQCSVPSDNGTSCSQCCSLAVAAPSPTTRRHSCSLIWLQPGAHHRAASSIQSSSPCSTLNTTNPNFFASPFCASTSSAAHSSAASSSSSSYSAHSSSFSSANHSSSITTHSNTLHATTTNTFATATNTANTASWIRNFDVVLTKRNSAHLSPSSSSVPLENYLYE